MHPPCISKWKVISLSNTVMKLIHKHVGKVKVTSILIYFAMSFSSFGHLSRIQFSKFLCISRGIITPIKAIRIIISPATENNPLILSIVSITFPLLCAEMSLWHVRCEGCVTDLVHPSSQTRPEIRVDVGIVLFTSCCYLLCLEPSAFCKILFVCDINVHSILDEVLSASCVVFVICFTRIFMFV